MCLDVCAIPAVAADKFAGTFKMNTEKSTGPAKTSEAKLVATDDGGTQSIVVTGKMQDGPDYKRAFSVPLNGGEGKIIEAAAYTGCQRKAFHGENIRHSVYD